MRPVPIFDKTQYKMTKDKFFSNTHCPKHTHNVIELTVTIVSCRAIIVSDYTRWSNTHIATTHTQIFTLWLHSNSLSSTISEHLVNKLRRLSWLCGYAHRSTYGMLLSIQHGAEIQLHTHLMQSFPVQGQQLVDDQWGDWDIWTGRHSTSHTN